MNLHSDTNLYSDPAKFGLRPVKDHDRADAYEFDIIVVWERTADGTFWIGHDSGCSCPMPFEEHGVNDLKQVWSLADVAVYARDVECWSETDVADLLTGLRFDGLPSVVDGSVVGSEPALDGPAAPPTPEAAPTLLALEAAPEPAPETVETTVEWGVRWPEDPDVEAVGGRETRAREIARRYRDASARLVRREWRATAWADVETAGE